MEVDIFDISLVSLKQPFERNSGRIQDTNLALYSPKPDQVKRLRIIEALNRSPTTRIRLFSFFTEACRSPGRPFLISLEEVGPLTFAQFEVRSLRLPFKCLIFGSLVLMEELVNRNEHIDIGHQQLITPRNLDEHSTCPIFIHTLLIRFISIFALNFHPNPMNSLSPRIDISWTFPEHDFERWTSTPNILSKRSVHQIIYYWCILSITESRPVERTIVSIFGVVMFGLVGPCGQHPPSVSRRLRELRLTPRLARVQQFHQPSLIFVFSLLKDARNLSPFAFFRLA